MAFFSNLANDDTDMENYTSLVIQEINDSLAPSLLQYLEVVFPVTIEENTMSAFSSDSDSDEDDSDNDLLDMEHDSEEFHLDAMADFRVEELLSQDMSSLTDIDLDDSLMPLPEIEESDLEDSDGFNNLKEHQSSETEHTKSRQLSRKRRRQAPQHAEKDEHESENGEVPIHVVQIIL